MGYNTDLIGHFNVEPHLNSAEVEWLTAYAETRRWDRPAGPYVVLGNPGVLEEYDEIDRYDRQPPVSPGCTATGSRVLTVTASRTTAGRSSTSLARGWTT